MRGEMQPKLDRIANQFKSFIGLSLKPDGIVRRHWIHTSLPCLRKEAEINFQHSTT